MTSRRITVVASEILGVPGTGGPGAADSLLAVALGRNGHEVELLVAPGRAVGRLSSEWEQIYADANVQLRPLEPRLRVRPPFLAAAAEVFQSLRGDPADVVIADDWRGLAYAALRARQAGLEFADTAFVVYSHGPARVLAEAARKVPDTVARFGEEVAERACIELADAVVSPSEWLLGWMREHGWPVPQSSARVIQNLWQSVALGEPAAQAPAATAVRRLAFFGQIREGKGIGVFVSTLRNLQPGLLNGVELLFLGRETPRWNEERVREALGADVSERVSSIRFETRLERAAAIQELMQPGTLAVMPSLLENSPYAVAECLEHGIPFIAARVGGVPELVAAEDAARVLHPPAVPEFTDALSGALSSNGVAPARPARAPQASLDAWLELIESVAPQRPRTAAPAARVAVVARGDESVGRAQRLLEHTSSVEVEVVAAGSRAEGLERAASEWLLFLDDDDSPDDGMLDALVAAQAASAADVVTAAVRPADDLGAIQLFLGEPQSLGLVENQYGVVGLVRRTLAAAEPPRDSAGDADWLLFARLALAGARVVSIPEPLSEHRGRPGTVTDVPGEGLAILEAFEEPVAGRSSDLPQLTATLAAALGRLEVRQQPGSDGSGLVHQVRSKVQAGRRVRAIRRAFERRQAAPVGDPDDPRPPLHVLHIGKTGGTALKHVLVTHQDDSRYQLLFRGHDAKLTDVPKGERFMFLIRDPLSRFVSAFNGRLREDRPRYHYPWRDEERLAFAVFKTPDQLATALSSGDDAEREAAEQAMRGIGHLNTSYWFWFGDEANFRARAADLLFIGFQERLDEDFALLKHELGLPSEAELPSDPRVAHKQPAGFEEQLSAVGRANLEQWYARDLAFVELCREVAPRFDAAR